MTPMAVTSMTGLVRMIRIRLPIISSPRLTAALSSLSNGVCRTLMSLHSVSYTHLRELPLHCFAYFSISCSQNSAVLSQPVAAPDEVLKKYSWDKTAEFWLHEMEKYAKQ